MKNKSLIFGLILTAIVAGVIYVAKQTPSTRQTDAVYTRVTTDATERYHNTRYGYSVQPPRGALVSLGQEEDLTDISESSHIQIFIPGGKTEVVVNAFDPKEVSYFSKNLKDLAIDVRNEQLKNTNSNFYVRDLGKSQNEQLPNGNPLARAIEVGAMQETIFVPGLPAYLFTLTGAFNFNGIGNYTLAESVIYAYVITEDLKGNKYLIHFPLADEISGKIIDTFDFDK